MLVWELGAIEKGGEEGDYQGITGAQRKKMEEVLAQYKEVFKEPSGLPPYGHMVHQIPLRRELI